MPAQKRKAAPATTTAPGGRRRSTRISSSSGTATASKYFEADDEEEEEEDELSAPPRGKKKRKTTNAKPAAAVKKTGAKEEEEEEEYHSTDDDDDDEPRVTIIPHVKLRDTGGVAYEDARVHGNTLLFLRDLKANNKRPWLKANDAEYRRSLDDWNSFVETLAVKVMAADTTIPELPLKDVVFRIYRDIRFSNDPTPYKPHYGAAFSRTGRKGPYACYYVHCEPGGASFVGGGLWHPDRAHLARLRRSIDRRPAAWRAVLAEERFRRTFLGAGGGDEESCVKAFARVSGEGALKIKPKGFDADHRDIALLKLRNFVVSKKIPDSVFTAANAQEQIMDIVRPMVGYVSFLNDIVMPDPNLDSDSSSDDQDEDGDED